MLYRLRTKLAKSRFNFACRGILKTPPVKLKPAPITIASMVCHDDLIMYLVSVKSFAHHLGRGRIALLDDGSLTEADKDILKTHLDQPIIKHISEINPGRCPKGGCWERLHFVAELSQSSYVAQLDSDIVTVGPIPELIRCVDEGRGFIMGTPEGQMKITLEQASEAMQGNPSKHVQVQAESAMSKVPNAAKKHYVRGCAGFSGFPKGSLTPVDIDAFSTEMEGLLGRTWHQWGSEQVTSNYLVANLPGSEVLPFPKYCIHEPAVDIRSSSVIHYYGPYRFQFGNYARSGRLAIEQMRGR